MKILVLSDSHATLSFMRRCIQKVRPNAVVHLGDLYDDGIAMQEENVHIPFYVVAGNCDRYRCPPSAREILCCRVCGVLLYMTHGHLHGVKQTTGLLLRDAREAGAAAALYGHTHQADCRQMDDIWILNPGACGGYSGSAGLIEVEDGKISACRILRQADIEQL